MQGGWVTGTLGRVKRGKNVSVDVMMGLRSTITFITAYKCGFGLKNKKESGQLRKAT